MTVRTVSLLRRNYVLSAAVWPEPAPPALQEPAPAGTAGAGAEGAGGVAGSAADCGRTDPLPALPKPEPPAWRARPASGAGAASRLGAGRGELAVDQRHHHARAHPQVRRRLGVLLDRGEIVARRLQFAALVGRRARAPRAPHGATDCRPRRAARRAPCAPARSPVSSASSAARMRATSRSGSDDRRVGRHRIVGRDRLRLRACGRLLAGEPQPRQRGIAAAALLGDRWRAPPRPSARSPLSICSSAAMKRSPACAACRSCHQSQPR